MLVLRGALTYMLHLALSAKCGRLIAREMSPGDRASRQGKCSHSAKAKRLPPVILGAKAQSALCRGSWDSSR